MNPGITVRRCVAATVMCTLCASVSNAQTATADVHRPAQYEGITDGMRTLSESDLKTLYRHCLNASLQGPMGMPEIVLCSTASEALLKRVFSGDFEALLAWSKAPRDDTAHDAAARGHSRSTPRQ